MVGNTPDAEPEAVVDEIRRAARAAHLDVLTGVQGDRLVAILGGARRPGARHPARWSAQFGPGPVVVGPTVPDLLAAGAERGGRGGRAARRPGLAGRAAPGAGRRPAARAGARRRRAGPRAPGRGDLPAAAVDRDRAGRDAGRLPRAGLVAGGDRAGAVRAPQHRALPAAPGRRGLRLRARGPAAGLRPADRAGPRPARRRPDDPHRLCRNPTKTRPVLSSGSAPLASTLGSERLGGCWSSSLPVKAPRRPASSRPGSSCPHFEDRLRWLSACAGLDLVHYGTEADAETIRDTAVAQPLLVAAGLVAALEIFPHPADAFHAGRRGRRAQRRRDHRRRRHRRHHAPSRRWCWSASAAGRWPTPPRASRPA